MNIAKNGVSLIKSSLNGIFVKAMGLSQWSEKGI